MKNDDLDWTPRPSRARVPIFCQQCGKQGRTVYQKGDDPGIARQGGSRYSGPTMRLTAFLAGAPRVCLECEQALEDMFDG